MLLEVPGTLTWLCLTVRHCSPYRLQGEKQWPCGESGGQ